MRKVRLEDLADELEGAQFELKAYRPPRPSELPDLELISLTEERSDFGERGPVIQKQLDRLEHNVRELGYMLMEPDAARSHAVKVDAAEQVIFDYASKVLPEEWVEERRLFLVKVMELMIKFYPPYVWEDLDQEMRTWVCESLDVDPDKVDLEDKEMMRRLRCLDSANLALPRIGTMGYRLGVFKMASGRDLPQQCIKIRAKTGNDDRLKVVELVCHYHGSAGLTQPLRHKIEAMRRDQRKSQKSNVARIKEGCTARFPDALRLASAISWFHLDDEKFEKNDGTEGVLPGGFVRIQIEDGWVYPVEAINWISRTKRWHALMDDANNPRIHVDSIGQPRFDQKGGPRLDEDTFANTMYWHQILNRAFKAQKHAHQVSDEGRIKQLEASISIEEWMHPKARSVGTAFTSREHFSYKGASYKGIEALFERRDGGDIRVAWCNEASVPLFEGTEEFADEYKHPNAFQVFLDVLHKDFGLPDID